MDEAHTSTKPITLAELFAMPETAGDVVARAGKVEITRAELEGKLRALQLQLTAAGLPDGLTRREVLWAALEQLIDTALKRQIAEQLGVKLDPAAVKAWLAQIDAQKKQDPAFAAFLARAGVNEAQQRADAELAVLSQGIEAKLRAKIETKTATSVAAHYEKRKADYTEPAGRETWRIVVKAPSSLPERDRAVARATAERIHAEATAKPAAFEDLARTHSEGGKGGQGGFIGWVSPGTLAPALEQQLHTARDGAVLPLYEDAGGFYIYRVGKSRPARVRTLEEVRDEIFDQLYRVTARREVEKEIAVLGEALGVARLVPELDALMGR